MKIKNYKVSWIKVYHMYGEEDIQAPSEEEATLCVEDRWGDLESNDMEYLEGQVTAVHEVAKEKEQAEEIADLFSEKIGFVRSYDPKTLENLSELCRLAHRELSVLDSNKPLGELSVMDLANIWAEVNTGLRKFGKDN